MLAFTINSFVYFGFANIYSAAIFNSQSFQEQFHAGIYQYRILSGYFLSWIYDFLSFLKVDYQIFKLKLVNPDSEPQMYLTFYILNTIFLMLCSGTLVLITESKQFIASYSEKILIIGFSLFCIALSNFVIVPYDVSSCFFLLLFFYFLLKYLEKQKVSTLILLIFILIISTFNRESSALSISLAATLLYSKFGLTKKSLFPFLILVVVFISVYFGLRLMSKTFTTNGGNLLVQNFSEPKNILGILFWLVFFVFTLVLAKDKRAIQHILLFHFLSLPYIIFCFYAGILYEIRLYIPLFLTSILLSKTEIAKIH